MDFIPVVGGVKGIIEGCVGYTMTGQKLSRSQRWKRGILGGVTAVVDCVTLGAGSKIIQGAKLATRLATTFGRMTLTNVTLAYGSKFATDAMQNLGCSPEVIMITHALAGAAAIGVGKHTQNLIDNLVRDAGLRSTKELGDILKYKNMKPRELESLLKSLDIDDILGLSEHTMQFLTKETGMTKDAILKELEKGKMSIRDVNRKNIKDVLGELKKGASGADDVVTYRRVQGGEGTTSSQPRISVDETGKVTISKPDKKLNLSVDGGEHSQYFLSKRPGADVVEFDVPKWLDDFVKEYEVPQAGYKSNPLNQGGMAPKITDITTPGKSIEFPSPWIEWIEEHAANGRIIKGVK